MKLSGRTSGVAQCGTLPKSEQHMVGGWLASRLDFYHCKLGKKQILPGQAAVATLIKSGLSPLKRRYRNTKVSAHAVVWGWLGRESLMGRLDVSVDRPRQGGTTQQGWVLSAMIEGGWLSATSKITELQRQEKLLSCLPRCVDATISATGWYLGSHCLQSLYQMLRRNYPSGSVGVDLLAFDVALLAVANKVSGDCLRYRSGGTLDTDWWPRLLQSIAENDLPVSADSIGVLEPIVQQWYTDNPATFRMKAPPAERTLWVLDLCCGFRSLDDPVMSVVNSLAGPGTKVICIGLDICPRQVRCSQYVEPDWCVDLLDHDLLPPSAIIESISAHFNLAIHDLVHVHASPPCITNSRADASNLNRGCGYRDWHSDNCVPLQASTLDPIPPGQTTVGHRKLAMLHDSLEKKLLSSLLSESLEHGFTFTVENPVGDNINLQCSGCDHFFFRCNGSQKTCTEIP